MDYDLVELLASMGGYFDEAVLRQISVKEVAEEIQQLRERVKELEEANKLLEDDAKRYRWLSEQNAELELDSFVVLGHDSTVEESWQKYWVGCDLDKAIDIAMENNNDNS